MKRKVLDEADQDTTRHPGESFLQRVHRRKSEARIVPPEPVAVPVTGQETVDDADDPPVVHELTDQDMPPLASLTADSDYSGFLSSKVSEALRRAALRKLFHGAQFNVIDEMDDYAEDFSTFTALGDFITSDMRHLLEVEARKQAEAAKQALLDEPEQDLDDDQSQAAQVVDESAGPEPEDANATPPRQQQET